MNSNDSVLYPEEPIIEIVEDKKTSYTPDVADAVFALFALILGYLFARIVLFTWAGWGVTMFAVLYLGGVTAYMYKKGLKFRGETWFWLAVTLAAAAGFSLWGGEGVFGARMLLLFGSAVYFTASAAGLLLFGRSGNFIALDALNMLILVPLRNLFILPLSFSALRRGENGKSKGHLLNVIIGLCLAIVLLAVLVPRLVAADSGSFSRILEALTRGFDANSLAEFFVYLIPAVPVALYIFGLVSGSVHGRTAKSVNKESAERSVTAMRILPHVSVYIALGAVCLIYLVFILCQIPYFFSAFTGQRPDGWQVYADYARSGFFELCQIAAINLVILIAANVMCKKADIKAAVLRSFNIVIACITLLFIATAFSKMALYISVYGLSVRRILPCVFMVFMASVCIAAIVRQRKQFSIARFGLILGAVLLTVTCLVNLDGIAVRYNADRYLAGTLDTFDVGMIHQSGSASVLPALEVYDATDDEALKQNIRQALGEIVDWLNYLENSAVNELTVEDAAAKRALDAHGIQGAGVIVYR